MKLIVYWLLLLSYVTDDTLKLDVKFINPEVLVNLHQALVTLGELKLPSTNKLLTVKLPNTSIIALFKLITDALPFEVILSTPFSSTFEIKSLAIIIFPIVACATEILSLRSIIGSPVAPSGLVITMFVPLLSETTPHGKSLAWFITTRPGI